LLTPGAVALAETYPAEALRHLGIRLKGSKRRQSDRAAVAGPLAAAMAMLDAMPDAALRAAMPDGVGSDAARGGRFDCILGVWRVVSGVAGNGADEAPADPLIRDWEGWVLGQTAMPAAKKERARTDAPGVVFGNGRTVI